MVFPGREIGPKLPDGSYYYQVFLDARKLVHCYAKLTDPVYQSKLEEVFSRFYVNPPKTEISDEDQLSDECIENLLKTQNLQNASNVHKTIALLAHVAEFVKYSSSAILGRKMILQ